MHRQVVDQRGGLLLGSGHTSQRGRAHLGDRLVDLL
jgi:hypothetical protein